MKLARAPHLGFLDGDDLWLPDMLDRHLAIFEAHPGIDLTFSLSRVVDEAGAELHSMPPHRGGVVEFQELLSESPIRNGSTVVVRREALERAGGFDAALSPCDDCGMWLSVALLRPANVYCVPEVLTLYRRRPGQLTRNRALFWTAWLRVLEKMRRLAPERVRPVEACASGYMSHRFAILAYEEGAPAEALRFLWLSLRKAPHRRLVQPGAWLLAAACLSRRLLPAGVHHRLEAWARRRRAGRISLRGASHGA